jgi:hypothetical protein
MRGLSPREKCVWGANPRPSDWILGDGVAFSHRGEEGAGGEGATIGTSQASAASRHLMDVDHDTVGVAEAAFPMGFIASGSE